MKIDLVLKNFSEKYDRDMIDAISNISNDFGLNKNGYKIHSFNINEAFDQFTKYLKGYGDYTIECMSNEKLIKSKEDISDSFKNFMNISVIKECDLHYNEIEKFVTSYLEGVDNLITIIDECKSKMEDAGVAPEVVGTINEYTDMFIDVLEEKVDENMDKFLLASGYTTNKRLMEGKPNKAVFA